MITSPSRKRALAAALVAAMLTLGLAGCGDDDAADPTPTPEPSVTAEPGDSGTEPTSTPDTGGDLTPTPGDDTGADPTPDPTPEPTTGPGEQATTEPQAPTPTGDGAPEALAVWPATDVLFTTPESAAADFVETVLGVPPVLGDFMAGDSRSGEIEVLSPAEGGGSAVVRSTLLLRQLAPGDGWFVLAAVSEFQTLLHPEAQASVSFGTVTIEGSGRGFEGTIILQAFLAGTTTKLDEQIASGGSLAEPAAYIAQLDLSLAEPGDTIMIVAKGGVGLETDPGEFTAIPVVVG